MSTTNDGKPIQMDDDRRGALTAYVFGELPEHERAALEAELARDPALAAEHARLVATVGLVREALPEEKLPDTIRETLRAAAARGPAESRRSRFRFLRGGGGAIRLAAAFLVLFGAAWALRGFWSEDQVFVGDVARREAPASAGVQEPVGGKGGDGDRRLGGRASGVSTKLSSEGRLRAKAELANEPHLEALGYAGGDGEDLDRSSDLRYAGGAEEGRAGALARDVPVEEAQGAARARRSSGALASKTPAAPGAPAPQRSGTDELRRFELTEERPADSPTYAWRNTSEAKEEVAEEAPAIARQDKRNESSKDDERDRWEGMYTADPQASPDEAREALEALRDLGYLGDEDEQAPDLAQAIEADRNGFLDDAEELQAPADTREQRRHVLPQRELDLLVAELLEDSRIQPGETPADMFFRSWGDHPFRRTADDPLSTFAVDVDTASYTLARRYLMGGMLPTREQVRTEEFVNYFRADRPAPTDGDVFALGLELAPTPFHPDPRVEMLRVTVRGKDVDAVERQPLALTFVIDVSGSMSGNRLELVKASLALLLTQLDHQDAIAVVSFANDTRLDVPMTSAANRGSVEDVIAALETRGGTNVEAGLRLGYRHAAESLTPHAVNRVILLSDGVGNIGATDQAEILALVDESRAGRIYLNTIGVGMGNHDDDFLEQLADRGDGLCQYVDSAAEAEKALVHELTKTLQPIARDVKIQLELDPAQVESVRQLGYENRALAHEDFRRDEVDAGEVNAGHQVTALYEIVRTPVALAERPLATVRVRYKPPFAVDGGETNEDAKRAAEVAREITTGLGPADVGASFEGTSFGFRRSVVVAQFAELLRDSVNARPDSLERFTAEVEGLARGVADADRAEIEELQDLVRRALPHLEARAEREIDELVILQDELRLLHYEQGQKERLAGDRGVDAEVAKNLADEIAQLELRIRELLQERYGPNVETEAALRRSLEDLGYSGDDR
jgi:Ca-activated chloride channel family protein